MINWECYFECINIQNMINKEIICIANIHSVYRSYIKLLTESWTLIKTDWEFAGQIFQYQNAMKTKSEEKVHSTSLFYF